MTVVNVEHFKLKPHALDDLVREVLEVDQEAVLLSDSRTETVVNPDTGAEGVVFIGPVFEVAGNKVVLVREVIEKHQRRHAN